MSIRKLTREEVPDGSLMMWISDVHIPIHHPAALTLAVEAAEAVGVTHVIAGGDIADVHCMSRHQKEAERMVTEGTLLRELEPGRWFLNWLATRDTKWLLGNHEDRVRRFMESDVPQLCDNPAFTFEQLAQIPATIEVLPQDTELRLGNLSMVHGHAEFKNGTGGKYPAHKMLDMCPDQSTIFGHLHRSAEACRTTTDEYGIKRTRRAYAMGHMSIEEKHYEYVSKHPNWQMGFGFIRVWWEGNRPRWHVYPIEVLFDRRNRPYFEFGGRVYQ